MADIPPNIEKILDLARWAPSGDNTQPWRFEIVDEHKLLVHAWDTRDWCVYDLTGRASQIAVGALLENIRIAATDFGFAVNWTIEPQPEGPGLLIQVSFSVRDSEKRDPLADFIRTRVTQRRPLSTRALTANHKTMLEHSVGPGYSVRWIEGHGPRWRMAQLLSRSARIRLTIPEAYQVHKRIIDWNTTYSEDRIPDKAVGLDPLGLLLMNWAMKSWERVDFLNRFLAGTWIPRLQLDLMPGFFCGVHFLIVADETPTSPKHLIAGGSAMQRFWLTATRLGLQFQPEMTPLIFANYVAEDVIFSRKSGIQSQTIGLAKELATQFGEDVATKGIFMGRLGAGKTPRSRSTRRNLGSLMHTA